MIPILIGNNWGLRLELEEFSSYLNTFNGKGVRLVYVSVHAYLKASLPRGIGESCCRAECTSLDIVGPPRYGASP